MVTVMPLLGAKVTIGIPTLGLPAKRPAFRWSHKVYGAGVLHGIPLALFGFSGLHRTDAACACKLSSLAPEHVDLLDCAGRHTSLLKFGA